ncbi:MAG TPA: hypothetical protein EYQ85_02880 [Candidatus Poseidoniales archaeon]|nr:MAG: hypothetical protein CXT68_02905 [Euryarchaeota archaeon]HIF16180.1 hypothetical protein [Candidatus Poseidoniales archaeon]HIK77888.1 hypothetical protein [Candidatus Poseidoniales archaeon]
MVTMTPPVINYLMAPAILFGDSIIVWELWFTFFVFLTSAVLFFVLEPLAGRRLGIAGAMTYSASPFGYYTCVAMIQDDAIIVVFIALTPTNTPYSDQIKLLKHDIGKIIIALFMA